MNIPPNNTFASSPSHTDLDATSVHSSSSRSTEIYNRAFSWQLNPSLTDLRSWRNNLHSHRDDWSSQPSFDLGLGNLSGKAIYWVGEKILDTVFLLDTRRRVWSITRIVKRMEKESSDNIQRRFSKKAKPILQLVDDLLELTW